MSIADKAADALRRAGTSKADAHRLRKLYERKLDVHLAGDQTADARRSAARLRERVADEAAVEAECRAILDKAEADAAMVEWETYRTEEASRREERRFISSYPGNH